MNMQATENNKKTVFVYLLGVCYSYQGLFLIQYKC